MKPERQRPYATAGPRINRKNLQAYINSICLQKFYRCEVCGCLFRRRRSSDPGHKLRFCSHQCSGEDKRRVAAEKRLGSFSALPWADCDVCQKPFINRSGAKRCGPECSAEYERRRAREIGRRDTAVRRAARGVCNCRECGTEFGAEYRRVYCSEACANRVARRGSKARARRRKRFRQAKRPGEVITMAALIERDAGLCQICKRKVSIGSWSDGDRLAPTVDHIIPIAHGGDHTWKNVQLAHAQCNFMRREVGPAQQRLW